MQASLFGLATKSWTARAWLPVADDCPEGGQHRRMTVITAGEDGQPVVVDFLPGA